MKKQFLLLAGITILFVGLTNNTVGAQQKEVASKSVEVKLVDNLDDERGYCFDLVGRAYNPNITNLLQVHTCLSYRGGLGSDQAILTNDIAERKFRITEFDVCMTATEATVGGGIILAPCEDKPLQDFTMTPEGRIILTQYPELCVTASDKDKTEGKGGRPKHVMRPVYLDKIDARKDSYQLWVLREEIRP